MGWSFSPLGKRGAWHVGGNFGGNFLTENYKMSYS